MAIYTCRESKQNIPKITIPSVQSKDIQANTEPEVSLVFNGYVFSVKSYLFFVANMCR